VTASTIETPDRPAPLPEAEPVIAPTPAFDASPPLGSSAGATSPSPIQVRLAGLAGPDPAATDRPAVEREVAVELKDVSCWYGSFRAVHDINIRIAPREVTAFIGPSGCGKSTVLRTINRMNDLVSTFRLEGQILLDGQDLYGEQVDPVAVRRRVGMVFQKPNPFPKSIFDNVAFGARVNGYKRNIAELVEQSLRRAVLWDEVKDKLKQSGLSLSGGQQQRLCIARAIATEPEVILMDEPCSALDPRATLQIEELMADLKTRYTIVIVTHNMQQAARASDRTAFLTMGDDRAGYVVEQGRTVDIFTNPKNQLTEDYVSGRFG
jgi:phosphate transport system ATP-binding protein